MPFQKPEQIAASAELLTLLSAWLKAAEPQEGCALVLGVRSGSLWQLERLWPCCNVWPSPAERCYRFAIDPREQLVAQKWARAHRLALLGSVHSHPCSAPVPSPTDRICTATPALMLIQGVAPDSATPALRCWWLEDPPHEPQELPLTRTTRPPWTMGR